jgi:MFS family permease
MNAYITKTIHRDTYRMPLVRQTGMETWYLTYGLLGAAVGGMLPIIIPLLALKRFGGAVQVGFVMAAYNLGGLAAPFWGGIADRCGSNRQLLFFALSLVTAVLALLSHTTNYLSWLGISLVEGIGVVGAVTLGTMFIVDNHPREEWSNRIGHLQMVNGGGQVCGLLLAALLSRYSLNGALLVAAGLTALAVLPGRLTPKTTIARRRRQPSFCLGNNWNREPQTDNHRGSKLLHLRTILDLIHDLSLSFKRFMFVWFLCLMGSAAMFTLYPVIMQEAFGIGQRQLSLVFATAMGFSLFLYPQAARCTRRFGSPRVLRVFLGIRLAAFVGLFALLDVAMKNCAGFTAISFTIIMLCWPFLGVGGTALTAQLSTFGKGTHMGVFNAVSALACVTGSALGGCLASWSGYAVASGLFVITETLALCVLTRSDLSQIVGIETTRRMNGGGHC